MKNILYIILLFVGISTYAQDRLPVRNYRVDNVDFDGDARYQMTRTAEPCLDAVDLLDTYYLRFGRYPSSSTGTTTIEIADNRNFTGSSTSYVVTDDYIRRERPRLTSNHLNVSWGIHRQNHLSVDEIRPLTTRFDEDFCSGRRANRITRIEDVQISPVSGYPNLERITFTYHAAQPTNPVISVRNIEAEGDPALDISEAPNGFFSDSRRINARYLTRTIRIYVAKRQVGDVYALIVSADGSGQLTDILHEPEFIAPGHIVTNINSDFLDFEIHGSVDTPRIFIDRLANQAEGYRRFDNDRWREGDLQERNSFNPAIKKYRLNFNGSIRPYEGVRVDYQVGGSGTTRQFTQLNGPTIRFRWSTQAVSNGRVNQTGLYWYLDLPPGWEANQMGARIVRFYTHDGGTRRQTFFPNINDNNWISGNLTAGDEEFVDNLWEMGVSFYYRNQHYHQKLLDHVSDNGPRDSERTQGGVVTYYASDSSYLHVTHASWAPPGEPIRQDPYIPVDPINYNDSYGCESGYFEGCYDYRD